MTCYVLFLLDLDSLTCLASNVFASLIWLALLLSMYKGLSFNFFHIKTFVLRRANAYLGMELSI